MAETHSKVSDTNEAAKGNVVEKMWLNYFNTTLYNVGLITETQYKKMQVLINSRDSSATKR